MLVNAPMPDGYRRALDESKAKTASKAPTKKRSSNGKPPDRWAQLNDFVDNKLCKLPQGNYAKVWICLFKNANTNGRVQMSQKTIAEKCGCNQRTVVNVIKWLFENDFLDKTYQGGWKKGMNKYRLLTLGNEM